MIELPEAPLAPVVSDPAYLPPAMQTTSPADNPLQLILLRSPHAFPQLDPLPEVPVRTKCVVAIVCVANKPKHAKPIPAIRRAKICEPRIFDN
jgi:hypothetical protein